MSAERSATTIFGQKVYDHAVVSLHGGKEPMFVGMCNRGECIYISPENAQDYIDLGIKGEYDQITGRALGVELKATVEKVNASITVNGEKRKIKDLLESPDTRADVLLEAAQTIVDYSTSRDNRPSTKDDIARKQTEGFMNDVITLDKQIQRQLFVPSKLHGQKTNVSNNPISRAADFLLLAENINKLIAQERRIEEGRVFDGKDVDTAVRAAKKRGINPTTVWTRVAEAQTYHALERAKRFMSTTNKR